MIKYFISYKNLINDNVIDKDVDIFKEEFKILKKVNGNEYVELPLLYFLGYKTDLLPFISKVEHRKKNIRFMVELTSEEASKFNPLLINRYETNGNKLKRIYDKDKVELIDFNTLLNMNADEISKGYMVLLTENNGRYEIESVNKEELYKNINKYRLDIKDNNLLSDIYFYTNDKDLLDKYNLKKVSLLSTRFGYRPLNYNILTIDSISQNRIIDFLPNTYIGFVSISNNALPVYIKDDNGYSISTKISDGSIKAYMIIDRNIETIMHNSYLMPLFKYINIYEYKDGRYIKRNIEEYITYSKELKYIRKENK